MFFFIQIFQRSESSSIITTNELCDFEYIFFTNRLAQDQHFVRNNFQIKKFNETESTEEEKKKILKERVYNTYNTHTRLK